jgi:tryptophan synthase alpha chain
VDTGPERIKQAIGAAKADGRAALLLCLPSTRDAAWLAEAAQAVVAAGADLLEFQTAYPRSPHLVVETIRVVADAVDAPCLLWSDFATVHDFALGRSSPWPLLPECVRAGVAGIVAPIGEGYARPFADACGADLAAVAFVAPSMEPGHLEEACRYSTGFTYAVGLKTSPTTDPGVFENLGGFLERVRELSGSPVFVGGGVATPQQAALAATFADGVAVGKAVFEALRQAPDDGLAQVDALVSLVRGLRVALVRGSRS